MRDERSASEVTPHWQVLRDDKPEVHEFLQELAEAVYVRAEDRVPLSSLDDTGFKTAESEGIVLRVENEKSDEEEVAFAKDDVFHDYLARHGASLLQESWNESGQVFAETFREVMGRLTRITGSGRHTRAALFRILAKGQEAKIILTVRELAERATAETGEERGRHAFWDLYLPFCDALPHLNIEVEELAQSAAPIIEAASGDAVGDRIFSAVEKMARQSKDQAIALYEACVSRPETASVSLAANALVGLSDSDFNDAHERALRLAQDSRPVLRRVGIAALGGMSYDKEHIPQLRKTWMRLESLRENPNEETDYVLVRTYGDLLDAAEHIGAAGTAGIPDTNAIGGAMAELAGRPNASTSHSAVQALLLRAENYTDADWYEETLLKVADTPSSHSGTIRSIDSCVNQYLEGGSPRPERALGFLRAFVQSRPGGGEVRELLRMTLLSLQENFPEELQAELTQWFSSTEPKLHQAAAALYRSYHRAGNSTSSPMQLSKDALDEISEQEVVRVVQRICGYVSGGGELLARLVLSALQRDVASDELVGFVGHILTEYVLYNYPEGGRKFLNGVVEEAEGLEIVKRTAHGAMERSERYYEQLRELPHLKEFDPPSSRIYQLRRAQQQQQSEMMEQVRNQSTLSGLFPRLPLKYGKAFFSERDPGEFTQPSGLSALSHSAEFPRGPHIDPVGLPFRRALWRQVGLKDEDSSDEPKRSADEVDEQTGGAEEPDRE